MQKKEISVEYISTSEQIADIFTKPLSKILFERFRNKSSVLFDTDSRYYWVEKAGLLEQHDTK